MNERLDHVTEVCDKLHIRPNSSVSKYLIPHPPAPQYNVFYFQPSVHFPLHLINPAQFNPIH